MLLAVAIVTAGMTLAAGASGPGAPIAESKLYMPIVKGAGLPGSNTTLASLSSDGAPANGDSRPFAISGDGRYVVFYSEAGNLVSGDSNGAVDGFVHDRLTGETSLVTVASDGTQGNGDSYAVAITDDGRYVTIVSFAGNLVAGDTNDEPDAFVHDRLTGETSRVSVAADGAQGNGPSNYITDISDDGRYVVFSSAADNLVSGDSNGSVDAFLHDRLTGETSLLSVASDGTQGNNGSVATAMTGDGRFVAIISDASNLVIGDTNGVGDGFVHDRLTGETSRVTVSSDGEQGNAHSRQMSVSSDGRYVAFQSRAGNLVSGDTNTREDIFVHDRLTGETSRVSVASDGTEGDNDSWGGQISGDGRYIAFGSYARNLVGDDGEWLWDVFVHDRLTGDTSLESVASDGTPGNDDSGAAAYISANGRYVVFASDATNLVSGDTNGWSDVFVRDRGE